MRISKLRMASWWAYYLLQPSLGRTSWGYQSCVWPHGGSITCYNLLWVEPSIRVTSSAVFKFVRVHRNFWMVLLGLFDKILIFWRKHVDIAIIFCIFFHSSHFRLKITFVWVFHMSKLLTNLGFEKPQKPFQDQPYYWFLTHTYSMFSMPI